MKKLFLILCIWVASINAMDQELSRANSKVTKGVIETRSNQDNTSAQSAHTRPNNQEPKSVEIGDLTTLIVALCAALY